MPPGPSATQVDNSPEKGEGTRQSDGQEPQLAARPKFAGLKAKLAVANEIAATEVQVPQCGTGPCPGGCDCSAKQGAIKNQDASQEELVQLKKEQDKDRSVHVKASDRLQVAPEQGGTAPGTANSTNVGTTADTNKAENAVGNAKVEERQGASNGATSSQAQPNVTPNSERQTEGAARGGQAGVSQERTRDGNSSEVIRDSPRNHIERGVERAQGGLSSQFSTMNDRPMASSVGSSPQSALKVDQQNNSTSSSRSVAMNLEHTKLIAALEKINVSLTRVESASRPGTSPAEALKAVEVLHRRAIHASSTVPEMRAVADRVGMLSRALNGMTPQQAAVLSGRIIQTNIPAIKQMIAQSVPVVATSTRVTVANHRAQQHTVSASRVVTQRTVTAHPARQHAAAARPVVASARPTERMARVDLKNAVSRTTASTTRANVRSAGAVTRARGEQHVARLNKVANRSYTGRLATNVRGSTRSVAAGIRSTSKTSQPISAFKARVMALRAALTQRFRRGEAVQVKRVARVRTGIEKKSALVKKTGAIKKGALAKKLNAVRKVKSTQVKTTKMRRTVSERVAARRATARRQKSDPSLKRAKSTKLSAKNIKNGKLAARRLERLKQRQENRRERVQSRRRPVAARGTDAAQQQELIKIMNRAFKKLMRTGEEDLLGLLSPMEQRMMRNVLKKLDAAATVHELKKALRAERKRKAAKQTAASSEGASETATASKKQGTGTVSTKSSKKEVGGGSQPSKSLDLNTGKVDDGNNKNAYEAALH